MKNIGQSSTQKDLKFGCKNDIRIIFFIKGNTKKKGKS